MACQLDALQRCLTVASLKKTLLALPKTLYDTYDRILLSIDHAYHPQAIKVFQWLVVARRPMYIEEVAEVVTILPTASSGMPVFDVDNRLSDPSDVFQICLSLVSAATTTDARRQNGQLVPAEILSLAHFSVKEYLTSEAIKDGPCSEFFVIESQAHMSISQACIAYLLDIDSPASDTKHPLANYAANFWNVHAELGLESKDCSVLVDRIVELLGSTRAMSNVHSLCKPHYPAHSLTEKPALHWATQYGLSTVVEKILRGTENINMRDSVGRTALHIAIQFRQEKIATFLIQNGIDIDAQDLIGTALHYAVHTEDVSIVQTLLDGKADPDTRIAQRMTPLYSAAQRNNLDIVKALLAHGASPNAPCRLTYAGGTTTESHKGQRRARDAVNSQHMGTALQVAAWRGFSRVAAALLDAGAVIENPQLVLLSEGQVQEALEALEAAGEFQYHFLNQLPDYRDTVAVLQSHRNKRHIEVQRHSTGS